MSLCIRGMISYDGCVMMSSDIPTASHPITIFAACFFFYLPSSPCSIFVGGIDSYDIDDSSVPVCFFSTKQ